MVRKLKHLGTQVVLGVLFLLLNLLSNNKLLGKESYVTLIEKSAQRNPSFECPYFHRKT